MKRWALVVAILYLLIILALTTPVIAVCFKATSLKEAAEVYGTLLYWGWIAVMVLSQIALLAVPVRFASRRPVTRGSLLPTVLASGLMMGGLAAGAICAVHEFATGTVDTSSHDGWCILAIMALTWCFWSSVFYRLGKKDRENLVPRQSRTLLTGSILELLVAVPTHIAARHRTECCAGIMTFIGLTMGISVMLFSFGPAVFFLFVARWRRLHPDGTTR
jgi:hypothetical protein